MGIFRSKVQDFHPANGDDESWGWLLRLLASRSRQVIMKKRHWYSGTLIDGVFRRMTIRITVATRPKPETLDGEDDQTLYHTSRRYLRRTAILYQLLTSRSWHPTVQSPLWATAGSLGAATFLLSDFIRCSEVQSNESSTTGNYCIQAETYLRRHIVPQCQNHHLNRPTAQHNNAGSDQQIPWVTTFSSLI